MSPMISLLNSLLSAPDKTGWPWTIESKPLSPLMPNGKPWPKISIVTPSYNQGQFLEETLCRLFIDAGFAKVQKWFPDTAEMTTFNDHSKSMIRLDNDLYRVSLNLEAVK